MLVQLRVVLRRNATKGRNNVLWCLSIVHAAVHSVSISAILTASIDKFGVTIVSTVARITVASHARLTAQGNPSNPHSSCVTSLAWVTAQ